MSNLNRTKFKQDIGWGEFELNWFIMGDELTLSPQENMSGQEYPLNTSETKIGASGSAAH